MKCNNTRHPNYSYKSWSIIKTRDRFGICWSWCFQNTPYMSNLTKFWLRYLRLRHMMPFFYFHDNWFVGDENNINLSNLFQKLFCSPPRVPISTTVILRNTIERSRMFNQLLLIQNVQISIVFLIWYLELKKPEALNCPLPMSLRWFLHWHPSSKTNSINSTKLNA